MTALYLCYQSLLDPLTQTQVIAYLEGLSAAGYRIVLLTFEPSPPSTDVERAWRERLTAKGIVWHWCRYHRRPTVPATTWDVAVGVKRGWQLIRQYDVQLVHARSHVPALMGRWLKRLTGIKLLFDMRGFMAEEYADAGHWDRDGVLFRLTKRVERQLVRAADGLVVLTEAARVLLKQWYPRELDGKPVEVIPCCVDLHKYHRNGSPESQADGKRTTRSLVYLGKLGGWYPTREMAEFFTVARQVVPELRWSVLTQSNSQSLREQVGLLSWDRIDLGCVAPEELPNQLRQADAGLCFYRRDLSRAACSPTKLGDYLAAGLPVVSTAGIGDADELLSPRDGTPGVGVLLNDLTVESYRQGMLELLQLWNDPHTPQRCRAVARQRLDLESVGWSRYRRLYAQLIGSPAGA